MKFTYPIEPNWWRSRTEPNGNGDFFEKLRTEPCPSLLLNALLVSQMYNHIQNECILSPNFYTNKYFVIYNSLEMHFIIKNDAIYFLSCILCSIVLIVIYDWCVMWCSDADIFVIRSFIKKNQTKIISSQTNGAHCVQSVYEFLILSWILRLISDHWQLKGQYYSCQKMKSEE
jgi:hypothetical protein